jgi:hypothetical protein
LRASCGEFNHKRLKTKKRLTKAEISEIEHQAKLEKKGQANLTLLSIARISSLLEKDPHLVFKKG